MDPSRTKGYDAAHDQRGEDDLDRWRFAAEIVEVIQSTPADWSARIGVFGKWGEGKSTILRFAEQMLKEKGNVVFMFNPWAIQNWNDLWEDFGTRLFEALSEAKVPFDESWKKKAKQSAKWFEATGISKVAETAADLFGKGKLYSAAFGTLGRWLRYDGAQIRAIRDRLKDRRIVVLIDDLDRCAPALIPQLLLSLRELLDLPGFTFVLAFDDEIVGQALIEKNPAWLNGADFLEKILDFRFHLPAVTDAQKERLIRKAIDQYCPFVPKESAVAIQDLLPNNPRKLKALIRSLAALQPQLARHDPDEFKWVDMWLAQMLRLESFSFFERLLKGDTLELEAGVAYGVLRSLATRNRRDGDEKDENQSLKKLISEVGIENTQTIERVIKLVEAIRARGSLHFRYACELAIRPQAVTWKEFRSLYKSWSADKRASILSDWVTSHGKERTESAGSVNEELFGAMLGKRHSVLSQASDAESIPEHDSICQEAATLLEMLQQFLIDLKHMNAGRFRRVYDQALYWIAFETNPSDRKLRQQEEALLLLLLSQGGPSTPGELLEQLRPWNSYQDEMGDEQRITDLKKALREKCVGLIAPSVAKEAVASLATEGGVRALAEQGRFVGFKFCLFHSDSPLWKTNLHRELTALILRGSKEQVVYENTHDLLDLIIRAGRSGFDYVTREGIDAVLSHHEFVKALWQTITSREIQYRMQLGVLQARQFLILKGVPEALLPLTKELQERFDLEISRNKVAPAAPVQVTEAVAAKSEAPTEVQ